MTALLALLILSQSPSTDAEIFVDRGETFLRAGQLNGLEVGSALEVLDARTRQPAGSALVMELWESLARVSLDSKAAGPGPKLARVLKPAEPLGQPQPVESRPRPSQGQALVGHVTITGAGEARRVLIYNRSDRDWHNCDVRLPNGRHYWIGDLDEGDDEGVMLFRFKFDPEVPMQPGQTGIAVICREGSARFQISL